MVTPCAHTAASVSDVLRCNPAFHLGDTSYMCYGYFHPTLSCHCLLLHFAPTFVRPPFIQSPITTVRPHPRPVLPDGGGRQPGAPRRQVPGDRRYLQSHRQQRRHQGNTAQDRPTALLAQRRRPAQRPRRVDIGQVRRPPPASAAVQRGEDGTEEGPGG